MTFDYLCRVTPSPRQEHLRAACQPRQEEKGPETPPKTRFFQAELERNPTLYYVIHGKAYVAPRQPKQPKQPPKVDGRYPLENMCADPPSFLVMSEESLPSLVISNGIPLIPCDIKRNPSHPV